MKSAETQADLETYFDLPTVCKFLCDQCGSFFITFDKHTPEVIRFQDKQFCHQCCNKAYKREARRSFPQNPYNLKNWIDVDIKFEFYKCAAQCKNDVNLRHPLSDNPLGSIYCRQYAFRKRVVICEICYYDFADGTVELKGLEDVASSDD